MPEFSKKKKNLRTESPPFRINKNAFSEMFRCKEYAGLSNRESKWLF